MASNGALATYAAQKYRKVLTAIITESEGKVDGYTRCTFLNTKVLDAEEIPST